ncbi:hypothetical protein [Paraglaciecola sp.]|uniref:tetratricopeptide repeat protein n=1 Tax=Paraglaciecola sp. TaxID=1920173 RepID=UPI0030F38611
MSMVRFSLVISLVGFCVGVLVACSATPVNNVELSNNNNSQTSAPEKNSPMLFNQQLEQDLNANLLTTLQSKIDVLSIAKHLRLLYPAQFANPLNTAKAAADVKQQLVAGIADISTVFSWHYMHSEVLNDNSLVAYYRIDSDSGYSYVTFWLEPDSYKIYDFHSVSFAFSALDFVGKFNQLFINNPESQPQLNNLVKALQVNDIEAAFTIYHNLAPTVKTNRALSDFLLRKYSQLSATEAQAMKTIVLPIFEQAGHSSLLFEAHYIQLDNFAAAIKMVKGLPLFALQDSKMQSELAILHAYNREFEPAINYGRQAIMAEPNQHEAYFVLLQVSFLAKDYGLSLDLMNVLVSKFDYIMGRKVISEFEESDSFIASNEYQDWVKQRTNS